MTLSSLVPLLPELILAVGAMALLMFGAFQRETERNGATVGWLAVGCIAAAAYVVATGPAGPLTLFNGAFVIDGFGRFMKLVVLAGAAIGLILAFDDFTDAKILRFEFPVLILLATTGMLMMVSAGDLIALYLGLELQSLALYVVAAYKRDDIRSSEAGLKYFVLGALSSCLLLYGASLVYGFTGTTEFAGIAKVAATIKGQGADVGLIFGLAFVLVGIAFKISAVPFHMWTPDVYEGAPTPVTAFFAAAPKIAAMALLMRVTLGAFPTLTPKWQQIVVLLACGSMVIGALGAIGQTNIKRLMAYSSIANIGFALVGLSAGTPEGTQGVLIYMAIYVAMTLGAFACILAMRRKAGPVETIADLSGLANTNLPLAAVLAMLMFSLAGIPPLAGFWAKYYAFLPAMKAGGALVYLAILGVVASVIGAYYYLRIVKVMFFDEAAAPFEPVRLKTAAVLAITGAFVLAAFLPIPFAPGDAIVTAADAAARSFRY
jgi:NADH-quinone oxidoreductase subunit N